jgi:hypothetical protein
LVTWSIWLNYYCKDVKILKSFLKPLDASPRYQYWTYFIASPFNHY